MQKHVTLGTSSSHIATGYTTPNYPVTRIRGTGKRRKNMESLYWVGPINSSILGGPHRFLRVYARVESEFAPTCLSFYI